MKAIQQVDLRNEIASRKNITVMQMFSMSYD